MSEADDQQALDMAFVAALAARRETFLARYPRKLKLAVTALLFMGLMVPLFTGVGGGEAKHNAKEDLPELVFKDKGEAKDMDSGGQDHAPIVASTSSVQPKSETESRAIAANDSNDATAKMVVAPDLDLIDNLPSGILPKVGEDGRKPWQVYSRPFDKADPRPRISIVVGDLGLSRIATDATLRRLPPAVTLAFDVQGPAVAAWIERARQDGHETLLSLPMEPFDFPRSDPGPNTLLTNLPNSDNIQRLMWALRQGTGYIGITTLTGSRFSSDPNKIQPIIQTLRERGLMILDTRLSGHSAVSDLAKKATVPVAISSKMIDANPSPQAIDYALAQLEQAARANGHAVGLASPLPVTLDRLEVWSKQLASRGIVLAPLSATME